MWTDQDGHERPDVVESRKKFIEEIKSLERYAVSSPAVANRFCYSHFYDSYRTQYDGANLKLSAPTLGHKNLKSATLQSSKTNLSFTSETSINGRGAERAGFRYGKKDKGDPFMCQTLLLKTQAGCDSHRSK